MAFVLPFKGQSRQLAGEVLSREMLFIVPEAETSLWRAMRKFAPQLRAKGRHVTALLAKRTGGDHKGEK